MRHYIVITTYAWDAYGMNGGLHDPGGPGGDIVGPIVPSYQGDTIDYCGNTVVVNGEVSRVAHDKGYITFDDAGDPLFHYYLRDHLGSVRVVFNEEDSTEQVNHYYASGALMDTSTGSAEQPLKYNGKELLREWGIEAYDYGARWMLPVTGPMFTQIDPLCEKYYDVSPYSYCKGNFMNAVDPDGRDVQIWYQDKQGKDRSFRFDGTQSRFPDNSFVLDFIHVYNYLKAYKAGENIINAVNNHSVLIHVIDGRNEKKDGTIYDSTNGHPVVRWESRKGLLLTNGQRQSPAVRLEHEFDHALDDIKNHKEHRDRRETPDRQYGNKEERRVTTGSETRTARKLHQGVRTDHFGTVYPVEDPRYTY